MMIGCPQASMQRGVMCDQTRWLGLLIVGRHARARIRPNNVLRAGSGQCLRQCCWNPGTRITGTRPEAVLHDSTRSSASCSAWVIVGFRQWCRRARSPWLPFCDVPLDERFECRKKFPPHRLLKRVTRAGIDPLKHNLNASFGHMAFCRCDTRPCPLPAQGLSQKCLICPQRNAL